MAPSVSRQRNLRNASARAHSHSLTHTHTHALHTQAHARGGRTGAWQTVLLPSSPKKLPTLTPANCCSPYWTAHRSAPHLNYFIPGARITPASAPRARAGAELRYWRPELGEEEGSGCPPQYHLGRHFCSDRLLTSDPARGSENTWFGPSPPFPRSQNGFDEGLRVPGHRCELDISKTVCNLPSHCPLPSPYPDRPLSSPAPCLKGNPLTESPVTFSSPLPVYLSCAQKLTNYTVLPRFVLQKEKIKSIRRHLSLSHRQTPTSLLLPLPRVCHRRKNSPGWSRLVFPDSTLFSKVPSFLPPSRWQKD